jgi:hypothetical protein
MHDTFGDRPALSVENTNDGRHHIAGHRFSVRNPEFVGQVLLAIRH